MISFMRRNGLVFALVYWLTLSISGAAGVSDLEYSVREEGVSITDCRSGASGLLVIPEAIEGKPVTRIDTYAFAELNALTGVIIPDTVTKIGYEAFFMCLALTEISIPDSVDQIGTAAFKYCTSLTKADLPDSSLFLAKDLFHGCGALSTVNFPDSITGIGNATFAYCASLSHLDLPDSVGYIDEQAFYQCTALSNLTLPDKVTTVGLGAFMYCTALSELTFPESLQYIGDWAFSYCENLNSVTFEGDAPGFRPDHNNHFGEYVFEGVNDPFRIRFYEGAAGFTAPTWRGYPSTSIPADRPWYGDAVDAGDGWLYLDWLGYFWSYEPGSPWIRHYGLNWAYCVGDPNGLWMYLLAHDIWLWTRSSFYPYFYDSSNRHYLVHSPGSGYFFDYDLEEWINYGN